MYYEAGRIVHDTGGKHVCIARLLMEEELGRELLPGEDVHHIDEDCWNNDLSNLQVMTHSEHVTLHRKDKVWSEETRKKISESVKKNWEVAKDIGFGYGNLGRTFSKEHCEAISKGNLGKVVSEETKEKIRKTLEQVRKYKRDNQSKGD